MLIIPSDVDDPSTYHVYQLIVNEVTGGDNPFADWNDDKSHWDRRTTLPWDEGTRYLHSSVVEIRKDFYETVKALDGENPARDAF